MTAIPFLDLKAQYASYQGEVWEYIRNIAESQQFVLGNHGKALETEMAAYLGVPACAGVSSGTDALILALAAAGIGAGDEVITTSYSFFATASAILRVGARPKFVDIELETYNLDPAKVEKAVTKKTKAVMPVHLYGHPADMGALGAIARRHKLKVIEDAAQSIGADIAGKKTGALGLMAGFSFFPTKNLGGWGDGGLVACSSEKHADHIRRLRNHGMFPQYVYPEVGINGRLDEIQAAVLRVKLKHLESWIEGRREVARRYRHYFEQAGIDSRIGLPVERPGCRHVWHQYVIRLRKNRDALKQYLADAGIGSMIYYPQPLHTQKCLKGLGYRAGSLPNAEKAAKTTLALPIYPEITPLAQQQVVDAIAAWLGR